MTSFRLAVALTLAAGLLPAAAHAECSWDTVPTPNPSGVINVITDSESSAQALHVLLIEDNDPEVGNPVEVHVLRREGDGWVDLGGPGQGSLDTPPTYNALHVDDAGAVWIGGISNDYHQRPVIARYDGSWSAPMEIDLINQVLYPFHERDGRIRAIDTAPDGTLFAVGDATSYGLTDDGSIPLFLVNDGSGWQEATQHETDWPGSFDPNTYLTDVIAFSSTNVRAVGRHGAEDDGAHPDGGLIVHWDGASISIVEDPREGGSFLDHPLQAMAAFGPNDIRAVGGSFFNPVTSTIAHYDGAEWTRIASPVALPLYSIGQDDDGGAWAASVNIGSDIARFDGGQWTAEAPPVPNGNIVSLTQDPNGDVWMLGETADTQSLALQYGCDCEGDMDGDGVVDSNDLFELLGAWGASGPSARADLDGDNLVNSEDLFMLLGAWGPC